MLGLAAADTFVVVLAVIGGLVLLGAVLVLLCAALSRKADKALDDLMP